MSQRWEKPDSRHAGSVPGAGFPNRTVGVVLLVIAALVAGGAVSYVVSQWQSSRRELAALPTVTFALPTTPSSTSIPTTTSSTTSTTSPPPPTTTTTTTITTTLVPTSVVEGVVGDHMVFADGYPLGRITPGGFARYEGDAVTQLRQGSAEMAALVNFIGSRFSVQVRPLDPLEVSPTCPIAVQPRAADNAEPLGLWVENPTWTLQPATVTPVPLTDPAVVAVIQLVNASNAVQPSPPPLRGSAISVDLIGDGVPDLVVSATYNDESIYYRMVAIAPDGNPEGATVVMLEFGGSFFDDGSRDPQSRGELRVDAVAELTGPPPFELVIRRTTSNTKGVTVRDLTGAELASTSCPR
jgi:hypothetical protein